MKKRCAWALPSKIDLMHYHDLEWGIPVFDDDKLFEMLILESAQAGLSWETILKRRQDYAQAFKNFNAKKVALMSDRELEDVLKNSNVIRNRLKIFSARKNARIFLIIQDEYGSFSNYLWRFVNNNPIINRTKNIEAPNRCGEADALSKDLKKRGMSFVGPIIMYAFMQAVGLVNDHDRGCFKASKSSKL